MTEAPTLASAPESSHIANYALNRLRHKRVLVTGGLGFIGSHLVLELLRRGAYVIVADPCVPGCGGDPENLGDALGRIQLLPFDIGHTKALERAIRASHVVLNLAGEIRDRHDMIDPQRDLDLNTRSQLLFLQACGEWNPGVRIVYAGTRQVYGVPEYLPVDERHPQAPANFNGVHKQAAAAYHLLLSRKGLIDACVLHLADVYGPGDSRMGLPLGSRAGDERRLRDPLHVDDAVDAFMRAAGAPSLPSRVYNVGGSESSVTDSGRIRAELGWRPGILFEDGMRFSQPTHVEQFTAVPSFGAP